MLDTCLDFISNGNEDRASVEDAVETYGNTIMLEVQTRLRELQALWAFKRTQKKRSGASVVWARLWCGERGERDETAGEEGSGADSSWDFSEEASGKGA